MIRSCRLKKRCRNGGLKGDCHINGEWWLEGARVKWEVMAEGTVRVSYKKGEGEENRETETEKMGRRTKTRRARGEIVEST